MESHAIVRRFFAVAGLAVAGLVGACSPLSIFDALAPADAVAATVHADIAYGEGPRRRLDVYVPG